MQVNISNYKGARINAIKQIDEPAIARAVERNTGAMLRIGHGKSCTDAIEDAMNQIDNIIGMEKAVATRLARKYLI